MVFLMSIFLILSSLVLFTTFLRHLSCPCLTLIDRVFNLRTGRIVSTKWMLGKPSLYVGTWTIVGGRHHGDSAISLSPKNKDGSSVQMQTYIDYLSTLTEAYYCHMQLSPTLHPTKHTFLHIFSTKGYEVNFVCIARNTVSTF
jgi:hypothetical protein